MKRNLYIILLSMLVLASACKKNQCPECYVNGGGCDPERIREHYAIGEDIGISYTDYNSVRDIVVHYAYDMDHFVNTHREDTILVEGYVGDWYRADFSLYDTAIAPGYYKITVDCSRYWEVYKKLRDKDEVCDGKLWIRAQFVLTSVYMNCWYPSLIILDTTLGGLI